MSEVQNKVLDNETRKKLMAAGVLGFTENPDFLYTPAAYRITDKNTGLFIIPKDRWAVFKLVGYDGIDNIKLENEMGYMEYDQNKGTKRWVSNAAEKRVEILKKGVKGWHTLFDQDGKEIKFETEKDGTLSDNLIKRLSPTLMVELSNAITDRMVLSPEELEGLEF